MKTIRLLLLALLIYSCKTQEANPIDTSKHEGLVVFEHSNPYQVLFSDGYEEEAKMQAEVIAEAYEFLSAIMGPREDIAVLVLAEEDWENNAYSPVPGMPEYYKGNLIVGAGHNSMAEGYADLVRSFPQEMAATLIEDYTNAEGELDMKLFFDKLSVHELTHSFQDPQNSEGYSVSRWLEELHANMGLYAFYKSKRPQELKYIMSLVDFMLEAPPPDLPINSLSEFDANYFEMDPDTYGFYQMRFTRAAQEIIDSLGNEVLGDLNTFILKYDESWKERLSEEELFQRLAKECPSYVSEYMSNW